MSKVKSVAIDFVSVFFFVLLSGVSADKLAHLDWATWSVTVYAAIVAAIGVILAALHPQMSRYGIGSE